MLHTHEEGSLKKATQTAGSGAGMWRPPWPYLLASDGGWRPPEGAEAGGGQKWRDGARGAVLRGLGAGRNPGGSLEMPDSQKAQLCPDTAAGMIHGQAGGWNCGHCGTGIATPSLGTLSYRTTQPQHLLQISDPESDGKV